MDKKWLSCHSMQKEIMLGTFQVQHVPTSLLDQLPALPSRHDKHHGHHPQGEVYDNDDASPVQVQRQKKWCTKGCPISNDNIVLSWKVDKDTSDSLSPGFEVPPGGGASPPALTSTWAAHAMMNATSVNHTPSSPLMCGTNLVTG